MNEDLKPRILAVIPAYNEERTIATVVKGAMPFLPVLVVDDGSSDHTTQQAVMAGAEVLQQYPNQGKGAALQKGFQYALDQGYDAVITLDADGQHDPAEIASFLQVYAARHADLIIGQRNFSAMPPVRRVSNTLGTYLFSWAVGQPIMDNQSGYRLVSWRLMQALLGPHERGFEFEVEMIVQCILHYLKMDWTPIRTIYGDEKSHINPLRHVVKFVQVSLRARHQMRAARAAGLLRTPAHLRG